MPRLMRQLCRPRGERGASAIIVGLSMTVLVGALGLSVDVGNVAYQRAAAQDLADSAATNVAIACGKNVASVDCTNPQQSAASVVTQDTKFTSANVGATVTSPKATVTVNKDVATSLLALVGVRSKHITATATASWNNGHPTVGAPMLPMGVPWCMYKNNLPPATAPLLLRSDVISVVFNVIVQGGSLDRLITSLLGDLLGVTEACTSPEGLNLKMLRGPIWLSGLEGAVNGIFNWNSSVCNMHLGTIDGFLGSTVSAVIPSNCMNRLGTMIKKGQIVMLPVYVPSISLQQLGLELDGCLLGICSVKVPPRLGVKVLGFAPFRITGWNYSGNSQPDPNAPACSSIDLLTHPSASVGCNGIQGYFVKTMQADANFTYTPEGADFGASRVKLTN